MHHRPRGELRTSRAKLLGDPGECGQVQGSPRAAVSSTRRPRTAHGRRRGPEQTRQRRPQHLAALAEGRVDDGEHLRTARGGHRRRSAAERDQARINVGYRPEDGRRHAADPGRGRVPGDLGRGHPVGPRTRGAAIRSATSA